MPRFWLYLTKGNFHEVDAAYAQQVGQLEHTVRASPQTMAMIFRFRTISNTQS